MTIASVQESPMVRILSLCDFQTPLPYPPRLPQIPSCRHPVLPVSPPCFLDYPKCPAACPCLPITGCTSLPCSTLVPASPAPALCPYLALQPGSPLHRKSVQEARYLFAPHSYSPGHRIKRTRFEHRKPGARVLNSGNEGGEVGLQVSRLSS